MATTTNELNKRLTALDKLTNDYKEPEEKPAKALTSQEIAKQIHALDLERKRQRKANHMRPIGANMVAPRKLF